MTPINSLDEKRNYVVPGDKKETITFATNHFIETAQNAIDSNGTFFVALSGGSTPKAIFQNLASASYKDQIDWSKVYLFWSDERSVPKDHSDSNYNMAMTNGFDKLNIPQNQIFRMEAESNLEKNAEIYEQKIKEIVPNQSFDLVMLGMGDDGHTASLFPSTKALNENKRLVVANFIESKDSWRMTFTFPCINNAEHIALYVLGESKAEMVKKVFRSQNAIELYPSAKIGTKERKALWILDKEASALCLN